MLGEGAKHGERYRRAVGGDLVLVDGARVVDELEVNAGRPKAADRAAHEMAALPAFDGRLGDRRDLFELIRGGLVNEPECQRCTARAAASEIVDLPFQELRVRHDDL